MAHSLLLGTRCGRDRGTLSGKGKQDENTEIWEREKNVCMEGCVVKPYKEPPVALHDFGKNSCWAKQRTRGEYICISPLSSALFFEEGSTSISFFFLVKAYSGKIPLRDFRGFIKIEFRQAKTLFLNAGRNVRNQHFERKLVSLFLNVYKMNQSRKQLKGGCVTQKKKENTGTT